MKARVEQEKGGKTFRVVKKDLCGRVTVLKSRVSTYPKALRVVETYNRDTQYRHAKLG